METVLDHGRAISLESCTSLRSWFEERLKVVRASEEARAYVVGLFSSMRGTRDDMSRESVVLAYARARETGDFELHQRIGDWTLWSLSCAPEQALVVDLGRLSYLSCYRLTGRSWVVYDELAEGLPRVAWDARRALFGP